ncbi:MAG TPA: hypothetical protein VMU94_28625 [Streptosporangiaceae bacterium]|nr:hypothetical protein [Streptosporangiaceae bacterium]
MSSSGADDIGQCPEVRRWLTGSGYDERPAERAGVLDSLRGFCEFAGQTPGELIAACLRSTSEGMAISGKGRRSMQAAIDEYVASRGLAGRDAIVVGNHVRGFLIHNGVFIQGPVSIS